MTPGVAPIPDAVEIESRRLMARRVPLGVGFFVGVVAIAGLIEAAYFPERMPALLASFTAEMMLCAVAVLAGRRVRLRPWIVPITTAVTLGVALCITLYVVRAGASGDALAFTLIIFLTGVALLFPWGARGQVPVVVGTVAAYLLALAVGVRGDLPSPYGIMAVGGGAVTSLLGAIFLDRHRRAIFHQRILLEQTRDRQMATLYDVTRTVTATLALDEVLHLVCESVLHALGLDRLWLYWREAPDGDVRGLAARREDRRVVVSELAGDPGRWEALLQAGADATPALGEPTPDEVAALAGGGALPSRVLRLPLEFRSELVGVALADASTGGPALATSVLDFAATLGNSAAMAIANARLHALLLHHREELQQLSNKGLAVVEDILRRISRELHDNTCQALMAVKMDLALLERRLPDPALRGAVQDVRAEVVEVMHGVRQMSHLIYPPVLDDFGAIAAIDSTAAKLQEATGVEVRVECSDPGLRFLPQVELLLFRVFQEALTNVVKHAAATHVTVRLGLDAGAVRMEIDDDGRGFDAQAYFRAPPTSAGLGLLGMRERVAHLGGAFRVTSTPGRGTRITVTVPAEPIAQGNVATAV